MNQSLVGIKEKRNNKVKAVAMGPAGDAYHL